MPKIEEGPAIQVPKHLAPLKKVGQARAPYELLVEDKYVCGLYKHLLLSYRRYSSECRPSRKVKI